MIPDIHRIIAKVELIVLINVENNINDIENVPEVLKITIFSNSSFIML